MESEVGHPTNLPRIWQCSWNWCPETFRDHTALVSHLRERHLKTILRVKKRDWDAYLRSTEGRSGATDSILGGMGLVYPSSSHDSSEPSSPEVTTAQSLANSVLGREHSIPASTPPPPTVTPLPMKSRDSVSQSPSQPKSPILHPSPMLPPSAPSASHTPLSTKRRRTSFASFAAQSSPMSTPSASSMPPSPALSNMITDAINAAGQINSRNPSRESASRSSSSSVDSLSKRRRSNLGVSPARTTTHPGLDPPAKQTQSNKARSSLDSTRTASAGSAQAVEDALTQNVYSSGSASESGAGSRAEGSAADPRQAARKFPESSSSHSHKPSQSQTSSDPTPQSYIGSHAVESQSQAVYPALNTQNVPDTHAQSPSLVVGPPLPRARRARSKTPAVVADGAAIAPAPTRVLRSRSKTPAPPPPALQAKPLPLPRRTTRSRTPSVSNTGADAAATGTAKGSTTGRTTRANSRSSVGASSDRAKAARTARAAGDLAPVREDSPPVLSNQSSHNAHPQERQPRAQQHPGLPPVSQFQPQSQPLSQSQSAFRSGTLQLPRRPYILAQAQAEAQARELAASKCQSQQPSSSDEQARVKPEPEADPPPSQAIGTPSQSQSQDEGGYREGYGFDLGSIQLMTQRPAPTESQGWWGSSQ